VAKERLKSPRVRLFVALDLPDEVRDAIVQWQREELADEALRLVPPASLHITLVFLGYHPERRIEEIATAATAVDAVAPRMELNPEPVGKPSRRPRLYALDAPSEEAVALQAEVERNLVEGRFYEPEKRPWWPHVTVARAKPEGRGSKKPARVRQAPGPLPGPVERVFYPVRLTLYRSNLRPQGAEYVPVAERALKRP
jgi:2'-5' RNA ligase